MIKKSIKIDGRTIAYLDNEQGELGTILFIHGNSFSSETFLPQFNSEILSGYRMLALDLYGHGGSDKLLNPFGYHLPNYALLVKNFLNSLNIQNIVLAGHSLGGHIALEILAKNPQITKSGIFIWGAPPLSVPIKEGHAFLPSPGAAFLYKEILSQEEGLVFVSECFGKVNMDLNLYIEIVKNTVGEARVSLGASVAQLNFSDESKAIENSNIEIAVVFAESDKLINAAYADELKMNNLWQGRAHTIEGSHFCHVDNPEEFNQLLVSYIQDLEDVSFFTNDREVVTETNISRL